MLKDWDAFEKLPEIDQMLLLEALMGTALMMSHLGEWWIAERLVADPRCRQWAYGAEINQRMNNKPRVTLRLIARMRRFARATAAYLRISRRDIINYAAIMIMPRAGAEYRAWSRRVR